MPQTGGASYLYSTQVRPFFASHESEIDSALSQLKSVVYNYLQQLLRSAWGHVSATLGQGPATHGSQPNALDEGGLTGDAAVHTGAPPTMGDPVSGPIQLAQTFWRSYGPTVIAAGAGLLHQAQNSAQGMNTPPAGPSRMQSTQSVLDRRLQLEAELASLAAGSSSQPFDVSSPADSPAILMPPADNHSRTSSSSSLRERSGSGNGKSNFEEVEVPSDMEGEVGSERPSQDRRSSWFGGWGNTGKGYERVKTE
ncbi:hypothetical protein EW026_g5329 [Hermanssonia centrifuga]|uniref:Uncharacterized protein n=2 Tax=Hermanssonia centrifuga TaxID=98765 RepID=A0A2R6QIR4_9APHY|nr:hypothetical protein PHLCEN_2v3446 [Hermanssonia centrifuga]THG96511.1 hypothetical protein EW026_g5329 [Hermanssonia centrifuga]